MIKLQHLNTRKKLISVLAIATSIFVGIYFSFYHSSNKSAKMDATTVEAELVKTGDILIQAQAIGALTAAKNVEITPEIAGQVSEVLFQDGSFVKQGTPLIQLDDKVLKAKLESAKANLFYSETNYKRMVQLGKHGAISQQAIDQAFADLKEKKATEEESQVAYDKMKLIAPFDGMIGKAKVSPGHYVTTGQSLVSLVDTKHLRVEYSVSEKYLSALKLNQDVKITTTAYPGKEFTGKVSFISPTINPDNRTITLYATVPNEDGLLTSGLFVNITHFLGKEDNALLIPTQSLTATIDGQVVYKVVNGKAVSTPIVIGQRNSDSVQVISGLMKGDVIVVAGQQKIKDGAAVETKQAK